MTLSPHYQTNCCFTHQLRPRANSDPHLANARVLVCCQLKFVGLQLGTLPLHSVTIYWNCRERERESLCELSGKFEPRTWTHWLLSSKANQPFYTEIPAPKYRNRITSIDWTKNKKVMFIFVSVETLILYQNKCKKKQLWNSWELNKLKNDTLIAYELHGIFTTRKSFI